MGRHPSSGRTAPFAPGTTAAGRDRPQSSRPKLPYVGAGGADEKARSCRMWLRCGATLGPRCVAVAVTFHVERTRPRDRAWAIVGVRAAGCGLRAAGCGLPPAGYGLRVTGYGHGVHLTGLPACGRCAGTPVQVLRRGFTWNRATEAGSRPHQHAAGRCRSHESRQAPQNRAAPGPTRGAPGRDWAGSACGGASRNQRLALHGEGSWPPARRGGFGRFSGIHARPARFHVEHRAAALDAGRRAHVGAYAGAVRGRAVEPGDDAGACALRRKSPGPAPRTRRGEAAQPELMHLAKSPVPARTTEC